MRYSSASDNPSYKRRKGARCGLTPQSPPAAAVRSCTTTIQIGQSFRFSLRLALESTSHPRQSPETPSSPPPFGAPPAPLSQTAQGLDPLFSPAPATPGRRTPTSARWPSARCLRRTSAGLITPAAVPATVMLHPLIEAMLEPPVGATISFSMNCIATPWQRLAVAFRRAGR